MMKLRWEAWKAGEQRGAFIVFTALAMWFLMMFVAFSVDFGNYYQHRSRLQNAADAAALAGVAEYTTEEIAKNTGAVSAPTLGKGRLIALVEGGNDASDGVKRRAREYVQNNYGEIEIKDNKVWSEEVTKETIENGVTTSVKTTHRYCRVDLEDTVQTFFARIFGVDSLTMKVSALAMMDGSAVNETWGQRLAGIGERLSLLAPNQIWESLINESSTKAFTITDLKDPLNPRSTSDNTGYGKYKNRYYVQVGVSDALWDKNAPETKKLHFDKETGKAIIGYKEPENGGICADPILADEDPSGKVTTKVFRIKGGPGITYNMGEKNNTYLGEIFALYLNRDHVVQRSGYTDRFTMIILEEDGITGSPYNPNSYTVPLYARLESEPIRIGKRAVMAVNGVFINVQFKEFSLTQGKFRPFVLAYDGPDSKRGTIMTGKEDREDAPWIPVKKFTIKKEENLIYDRKKKQYYEEDMSLSAGEITQNGKWEPWLFGNDEYRLGGEGWSYSDSTEYLKYKTILESRGMVRSAMTTSGPIYVDIPQGCVFYGALYAPNSRVILSGSGKIYGFIAAREIVDTELNAPRSIYPTEEVDALTMSTVVRDRSNDIYDYEKTYVKGTYNMAFTDYVDFTDPKYYENYFRTDKDGNLILKELNSNWR